MDKMRSWAIYNSECPIEIFDESGLRAKRRMKGDFYGYIYND